MYLQIERYEVSNPILRQYVNFFWTINQSNIDLNHKFLPLKNIDLIINLSSNSKYRKTDNREGDLSQVYFMGIMDKFKYNWIIEGGKLDIIGISFSNFGLFPFVKKPLAEFKNEIIDFHSINTDFTNILIDQFSAKDCINSRLNILEHELLKLLDNRISIVNNDSKIINAFCSCNKQFQIDEFCSRNGVNSRKLERLFSRYVGISPKKILKISRFQRTLNQIIKNDYDKLSDLAFDNGYYDQMHFIRDFKIFTSISPKKFIQSKTSLKQISGFS